MDNYLIAIAVFCGATAVYSYIYERKDKVNHIVSHIVKACEHKPSGIYNIRCEDCISETEYARLVTELSKNNIGLMAMDNCGNGAILTVWSS